MICRLQKAKKVLQGPLLTYDISNGVCTEVVSWGLNHWLSVKNIKVGKEKVENITMGIQFV